MFIDLIIYKSKFSNIKKITVAGVNSPQFYSDLYRQYNSKLEINFSKQTYSYEALAYILFNKLNNKINFKKVGFIFFPTHGFIWHSEHSAPILHLKNKYNLNCEMLDIKDCGYLCVYNAVNFAKEIQKTLTLKNIIICSIENAWLCEKYDLQCNMPCLDYCAGISISLKMTEKSILEIINCIIIHKKKWCMKNFLKNTIFLKIM